MYISQTPKFPIYAAASQPSNYSAPGKYPRARATIAAHFLCPTVLPSGTPATTAVITDMPNPTQE